MIDTGMIGKGFGIAAIGIGTAIALESMRNVITPYKKTTKIKPFKPLKFEKIKW